MVTCLKAAAGRECKLILQPNQSLSWRYNYLFLIVFSVVSLVLALLFLLAGAWLILPFLLLEFIVISALIYCVCQQLNITEVISISDNRLLVEKGGRHCEQQWSFERSLLKLIYQYGESPLDPIHLSIAGNQGVISVGEFLNDDDRAELLSFLEASGLHAVAPGPLLIREF